MFRTPYETTTLSMHNVVKIKNEIELVVVNDSEQFESLDNHYEYVNENVLVLNDAEDYSHIPFFTQPLVVNTRPIANNSDYNKFVIDCRGFVSKSKDGVTVIKKPAQYRNHLIGAGLSTFWYLEGNRHLLNIAKFPAKIFSHWITGTLASKLNLDEIAQVKTSAIVAYYFLCLFENFPAYAERQLPDDDKIYDMGIKVGFATGLKVADAIELIREIPTMATINDLSTALKEHGGSDRFKQLDTPLLYMLLGRFGMNGLTPETVLTSLEYPPLFLAMIYIAATERGYNKSPIGNLVHNMRNMNDVKTFTMEITRILKGD